MPCSLLRRDSTAPSRICFVLFFFLISLPLSLYSQSASNHSDPFNVARFDCNRVAELGVEKQGSFRAASILHYCSTGETDFRSVPTSLSDVIFGTSPPPRFVGFDINLITGTETVPHVVQAESSAWAHGNTIVVAMDDSRGVALSPLSVCSVSVSTDGGGTFTRLPYAFNQTGACFGDPTVFYSVRAGKWFVGFFAGRCPNTGFGQWESPDGINWSESGCLTGAGVTVDWLSSWVDNNPASPYYGRQYASFNDYTVGGQLTMVYSTDDGVNWSSPVVVTATTNPLRRAVRIFGSLANDGTIFVQALDEGGGGMNPRANLIFRSTNGGVNWSSQISQGPAFAAPGRGVNGYFAGMYTTPVNGYWRYMGYGQPGAAQNSVIHYVYTVHGVGSDAGDVFYIRSIDNGGTWSAPLRMNTDVTTRAQFQPSIAVNARGKLVATWFDERNTVADELQRYFRVSHDNGLTWGLDTPLSDPIFPKPLQQDPNIVPTYVGDRHDAAFSNDGQGNVAYDTWTDGRVLIGGSSQQDVFFDRINFAASLFDFDGDGKTDIGISRPVSPAQWWINKSSNGQTFALQFGAPTDRLAPADYTGDGKTDIAFWRPSTGEWFILRSEDFSFFAFAFGTNGDVPAPADYDNDLKADAAVFRPSSGTWYVSQSGGGGNRIFQFGVNGDQPIVSDYDGDGKADAAIVRASGGSYQWWIQRSTAGVLALQFGASTDKAVPGDYTGDGKSDVALWRPSTGEWFIVRSENMSFFAFPFGTNGDVPAPGDYDGDGKFDATVFRPSSATWFIARSTAGTQIVQFGANGDRPIPNAFVP
jgi:hypothetical protein